MAVSSKSSFSKKVQAELQVQFGRELESAHLYLAMAAKFNAAGFDGLATWMKKQSAEEYQHAMKIYEYLDDREVEVVVPALKAPKVAGDAPLEIFQEALAHEKQLTEHLNALSVLALKEGDHVTVAFLGWFLNEQVEEIASAATIVDKFTLIGDEEEGLYLLDRELGKRE